MKVLFLDFDGVMNSGPFVRAHQGDDPIDPAAVQRLNEVLRRAGPCSVVISSSWRYMYTYHQIQEKLDALGFSGHVMDVTPDASRRTDGGTLYESPERGHEIQSWMDDNGYDESRIAIVDDDSDMAHLRHRLVKTSFETGLLDEQVEALVVMLGETKFGLPEER